MHSFSSASVIMPGNKALRQPVYTDALVHEHVMKSRHACAGLCVNCKHSVIYQVQRGGEEIEITHEKEKSTIAALAGQGKLSHFWQPSECTNLIWPYSVKKINQVRVGKIGESPLMSHKWETSGPTLVLPNLVLMICVIIVFKI